ncbi:uncharacterized protein LOC108928582 [Scleropages formosus]|uniref:uncharacterized protein LOC108928582 n=1 Tax=Scleropages formosus TaxID=113540 RepID=UPI0008788944|nr:uncharacterized protein LOC108928582 [Scleropages formosus]
MVKLGTGINHLIITKIEWSDSAMYYCVTRSDYSIHFGAGTFLWIKGSKKQQFNTRTVVQQLVSDPVYPGDSVTLQCTVDRETCSGEHSVYWFRHGSGESLPGFIYTHGNRSDECEKSPEAGSPTHGCVYSLPKRNLSRSDAGIYYCAVLTCGDILFGNGTQLDIEENVVDPLVLGFGVSLTACVIVITLLIFVRKNKCNTCSGGQTRSLSQGVSNENSATGLSTYQACLNANKWTDCEEEMLHYAALHITNKKLPKSDRKKRDMKQESVYSDVTCRD